MITAITTKPCHHYLIQVLSAQGLGHQSQSAIWVYECSPFRAVRCKTVMLDINHTLYARRPLLSNSAHLLCQLHKVLMATGKLYCAQLIQVGNMWAVLFQFRLCRVNESTQKCHYIIKYAVIRHKQKFFKNDTQLNFSIMLLLMTYDNLYSKRVIHLWHRSHHILYRIYFVFFHIRIHFHGDSRCCNTCNRQH